MNHTRGILIVDDEINILESLDKVLQREHYQTFLAPTARQALSLLENKSVNLVLSDLMMPEIDGMALLKHIKIYYPEIEVLLITGHATVERAVDAMREGAYDFITKPFKRADILTRIGKALEKRNLKNENRSLKAQLRQFHRNGPVLVGETPQISHIRRLIDQLAPTPSTVLITGESGTGKEIIAKLLHARSHRAKEPFIAVNCGAIAENLIESELFGHVKGAFTGAIADKEGLFKTADGGTLFLDEVGALSPGLQVKMLRVLEEQRVRPVGSTRAVTTDVRILAACNRDLAKAVENGAFREDLYYRLNVVAIHTPPLREHREDIPLLIDHFRDRFNRTLNKEVTRISEHALQLLLSNSWKGNVRELRNAVEHAMILTSGGTIELSDLPLRYHNTLSSGLPVASPGSDLKTAVAQFERIQISRMLSMVNGDKKLAAAQLGLSISSLYRKMNELSIDTSDE